MKKTRGKEGGITLISLVITIIIMLILVAVSITLAVKGGLFGYAGNAIGDMKNVMDEENAIGNGGIQIGGKWYDSINDYVKIKQSTNEGTEVTWADITLSISEGTKVTNVPVPDGFSYAEGTIDTGYVIEDKDGNEFVWVPVNKNQKITLKVKSEKEIEEAKLYDPAGNVMLTLENEDIKEEYVNNNIEPTKNGAYIAVVKAADGEITQKSLTVKSLYALDTGNEVYTFYDEDILKEMVEQMGTITAEALLEQTNSPTLQVAFAVMCGGSLNIFSESVGYSESVNKNGGFYIGRYEAGTTVVRGSRDSNKTAAEIISEHGKPVTKEGAYPYNNVTHLQAKELVSSMYDENESFETCMLTGIAWSRILGWLYETKSKTYSEIYTNGENWGNLLNAEFTITKGQYSNNFGYSYQNFSGTYKKTETDSVLLTTGATERNRANNIYDLVGNVAEWTMESQVDSEGVTRYRAVGGAFNISNQSDILDYSASCSISFRVTLYLK